MAIDITDLDPETRKKLAKNGIKAPRQTEFTKDAVRTHAIQVLAAISGLTQAQRSRVLTHATKVNNV